MACGVPVVVPRRGTYTEIIERTGGGVLVPPDDLDALVDALGELGRDSSRRHELGAQGAAGVRAHYTASDMAQRALDVYAGLTKSVPNVA